VLIRALIVVFAVAVATAWYVTLPPRASIAAPADEATTVRGAIHVHTSRSDGTGSLDNVAAAAARAGLDFVVFTDHGNATLDPEPPRYRFGVLCIDAVEISTRGGHILALGLPRAPYPLGGEARDVLADIARMGGMAIAAHPGSLKPELQWADWTLPVDGIEWLNADSEWRDESPWTLVRALFAYPGRPTESVAGLLDRPAPVLQRWDEMLRTRPVVAVAATDAHARLGFRSLGEPYDNGASLHLPAYERMFRVFSNVLPGVVLTGDAAKDAGLVLDAIRSGQLYSRVDAIGPSGTMAFASSDASLTVSLASAPQRPRILLLKDGQEAASSTDSTLTHPTDAAGVYRVEVSVPGAPGQPPVPWIMSNPIYVGRNGMPAAAPASPVPSAYESQYSDGSADRWTVETSPASRGAVDVAPATRGTQLAFRYALGGSARDSAYAALAMTSGGTLARFDRIVFTANADRPMRLSVQLRTPGGQQGERWQRSVFVGEMPREITVFFDDMRAAGPTRSERAPLDTVDSVLFVVDTVNTPLGGSGRVWIDDVKYGR
jgi:hypothetical protein